MNEKHNNSLVRFLCFDSRQLEQRDQIRLYDIDAS